MKKTNNMVHKNQLVDRLCAGEEDSYVFLMREYWPRLYAIALRYTKNDEDAKDCVQQTYIKIFKNIHKFEKRSSLWTWMRKILINVSIETIRSKHKSKEISIDDLLPEFDKDGIRTETNWKSEQSLNSILASKESVEFVRNAIFSLPDNYRLILMLRDIEGYSTEEAANMLNISISASKTRLHRARAAIRTLLTPLMNSLDEN